MTHVTILEFIALSIASILVYTLLKTIWEELTQYK